MFGRRVAITLIKDKRKTEDPTMDNMTLDEIGNTVVDTIAGVGTVVVVVATTLTALRVTEHIVKYIFR